MIPQNENNIEGAFHANARRTRGRDDFGLVGKRIFLDPQDKNDQTGLFSK